ncbi:MAG: hypothetical protein GY737_12065 [Desulfobacteraceae bacterium]|nr:hypothetical protein [Desulfobacteraceae bacterium]
MIRKVALLCFWVIYLFLLGNPGATSKCLELTACTAPRMQGNEFTLFLDEIATLPENNVFLSGHLTGKANRQLPVLLVSIDGGRTWKHRIFEVEGAGIENLRTYGEANLWATITFQTEGLHTPEYLLRSENAGNSWCMVSLDFIEAGAPLIWLSEFRFLDDLNGIFSVSDSLGSISTYYTKNGGDSWNRLWKTPKNTSPEIDTAYRYPGIEPSPAHAPLWTRQDDFYKITGILRLCKGEEGYIVEQYLYSKNTSWKKISKISTYYKIDYSAKTPPSSIIYNAPGIK